MSGKTISWMRDMAVALAAGLVATAASADQGAIYGTVTLDSGKELSGVIRWEDEEAYWLHHFNGRHAEPYDISGLDDDAQEAIRDRQPGPQIELDNGTVIELVKWFSDSEMRPTDFAVEFGAIESLEWRGSRVDVRLRDGTEFEAQGGSNDIDTELFVKTADGNERELEWNEVERVVFAAAPPSHPRFPTQLYGRVKTRTGELTGLVIWDQDERMATEKLDGDLESGEELSIEFGDIRSIISRGNSSLVVLDSGEEHVLFDSNDVDADNRGIMVVHPDFGHALVDWSVFERVDFEPLPEGFLPGWSTWADVKPLRGTIETVDGRLSGQLAYDIDETLSAHTLEGRSDGIDYTIPFRLITAVEKDGEDAAVVTLQSGQTLRLAGNRDVNSSNNGMVVDRRFIPWESVKTVRFD